MLAVSEFNRQAVLEAAYKRLGIHASAKARAVALALGHMSESFAPSVRYSVSALQEYTGLSRSSVQRGLRELEQFGFLADPVTSGRTTSAVIASRERGALLRARDSGRESVRALDR